MSDQARGRQNQGYLYPNASKTNDRQPDFRGKLNVGGKEWLLSGWRREKDGQEMISVSLTDPNELPARSGAPAARGASPASPSPTPSAAPPAAGGGVGDIFDDLPG